jgi:hypothetical protein
MGLVESAGVSSITFAYQQPVLLDDGAELLELLIDQPPISTLS